jgi:hypothetical protein
MDVVRDLEWLWWARQQALSPTVMRERSSIVLKDKSTGYGYDCAAGSPQKLRGSIF